MKTQRRSLRRLVCVRGVPYQAQLSPVVSDNGDMVGTVLAFRNFQQEQKLDEMKNELVNVVSHELRTPLTAIKNALSLLHGPRLGALNDKQQRFVRLSQTNVEQLVGIINDLLDLSKLEAGKMHIDLEPLSLAEPIAAALSSLEPPAEAKGVSLQSSTGNDLPLVHGDAASIQRLLINLVGNAIKFTDPGGRVLVEATTVEGESGCASGTAVRVTVSDTGVGVPKDQLESIFDKFHQVTGASRHTTTVGTGLGLPICRELIKAHHGRIWAESDEGSGSRFSFTLPLLDDYELLLRCLETDIARAGADGTSIVVTLLSVREDRSSGADPRPLDVLRDVAKSVTRRSADRVFLIRNKSQVVIVLPRTPGEGGAVFGERFAAELQKANLAKEFSVEVGSSTFPDDGGSADSLYSRAEASLREPAPAEPALESETKTSTEGKRY
jgi:signal transduction histidine kinase